MINSRKELKDYITADRKNSSQNHKIFYLGDEIGKYLFFLRKREYYYNKTNSTNSYLLKFFCKSMRFMYRKRQHRLGIKLGFNLPINVFGPGLRIDHWGFLAVNGKAIVGKNCHIYGDVTIGIKSPDSGEAPVIGNNCIIGAGARILGPVIVADNCSVGANAVVTHNFMEKNTVIVGIPAHAIKKYDSSNKKE